MESVYSPYAWLILLFPFVAFVLLIAFGRQLHRLSPWIGTFAAFASFVIAALLFGERIAYDVPDYSWAEFRWLNAGEASFQFGFEVNALTAFMLFIVALVALAVNVYSAGYMKSDERLSAFYCYLALFSFAMLGLVLSENLLQLFIFWELVGVSSFLLIGFWFVKPEAKAAAKKAFIITRIGDVALFIAIWVLFWRMPGHGLGFTSIHNAFHTNVISAEAASWIALLIFIGAMGKSAQFPLFTWLPDAMTGPTPISALIHAATMVAAGVFLVARTYDVFLAAPAVLDAVLWIGIITALLAAVIAAVQTDVKRVLAFSTVSQLGFMMTALGVGTWAAYASGLFHLHTHAFFKALLFLGAGSIIHVLGEQDIGRINGAGHTMRITKWTFAVGALALSGLFPFAGFWSKEAILAEVWNRSVTLFAVSIVLTALTAFYMSRLYFYLFSKNRSRQTSSSAKESPWTMTIPMIGLAVLSVTAGLIHMPHLPWLGEWLTGLSFDTDLHVMIMIASNLSALIGIGIGYLLYGRTGQQAEDAASSSRWRRLIYHQFYIDDIYAWLFVKPLRGAGLLLRWFDRVMVSGAVHGTAALISAVGRGAARLQHGQLQGYGLVFLIGAVILAAILFMVAGRSYFHVG